MDLYFNPNVLILLILELTRWLPLKLFKTVLKISREENLSVEMLIYELWFVLYGTKDKLFCIYSTDDSFLMEQEIKI